MCSEAVSISRDIKQTSGLIKNEIPKNRMYKAHMYAYILLHIVVPCGTPAQC
jgi:hypothetical protein